MLNPANAAVVPQKIVALPPAAKPHFQLGDRICRRAPRTSTSPDYSALDTHFGRRKTSDDNQFLIVVDIATFASNRFAGYFCKDRKGRLHLVHNLEVRRAYI
jgi:hypothetical protein